jgi:CRP-like cAMP-binding protein
MTTFIAGIDRLGASRASIVSGVQPALTPVLGFLVFADRLRPQQIIGGALVVAAVAAAAGRSPESPARLPLRARRRLARMTGALEVPAGSRLVRQGTHADAFYVIEQGRATVERDDRRVADLGTGEFFGELALLRGGRRTASVTAATDMRVQVIPRRHFGDTLRELPALARAVRAAAVTRLVPLRAKATAATAG